MYILKFRNKNFAIFPKCGSTTLIKLCTDTDGYKEHHHSYNHNNCDVHGTIHKCGKRSRIRPDKNLETIVVFRYPHERIISYYYANYKGELGLRAFVGSTLNKYTLLVNRDLGHHLEKISSRRIRKVKNKSFVHLRELNDYLFGEFGIDISNYKIPYKTKKKDNFDSITLNKIKRFYAKEYDYLNKNYKSKTQE